MELLVRTLAVALEIRRSIRESTPAGTSVDILMNKSILHSYV